MTDEQHTEIIEKLDGLEKILNGNGKLGLVAKVQILWSLSTWVLCTLSAGMGCAATWFVTR